MVSESGVLSGQNLIEQARVFEPANPRTWRERFTTVLLSRQASVVTFSIIIWAPNAMEFKKTLSKIAFKNTYYEENPLALVE